MSRSLCKVFLIGNLVADPEALRYTPAGVAVTNVRLATNESWKKDKQTGESQQRTEWHRLVFYAPLAEIVQQYLRKGSRVWVEGRIQTREWEKEGQKQYIKEIIVNQLLMLDSRGGPEEKYGESDASSPTAPASPPTHSKNDVFDDDIPF
jgi:single-strand DNA-binding protein